MQSAVHLAQAHCRFHIWRVHIEVPGKFAGSLSVGLVVEFDPIAALCNDYECHYHANGHIDGLKIPELEKWQGKLPRMDTLMDLVGALPLA